GAGPMKPAFDSCISPPAARSEMVQRRAAKARSAHLVFCMDPSYHGSASPHPEGRCCDRFVWEPHRESCVILGDPTYNTDTALGCGGPEEGVLMEMRLQSAIVALVWLVIPLPAQESLSTLRGTVTDR